MLIVIQYPLPLGLLNEKKINDSNNVTSIYLQEVFLIRAIF